MTTTEPMKPNGADLAAALGRASGYDKIPDPLLDTLVAQICWQDWKLGKQLADWGASSEAMEAENAVLVWRTEELEAQVHECPDCGEMCKGCQCYEKREAEQLSRIEAMTKVMRESRRLFDEVYGGAPAWKQIKEIDKALADEVSNGR